ncbi:unnamed protein product [Musa hybrid cultivar]
MVGRRMPQQGTSRRVGAGRSSNASLPPLGQGEEDLQIGRVEVSVLGGSPPLARRHGRGLLLGRRGATDRRGDPTLSPLRCFPPSHLPLPLVPLYLHRLLHSHLYPYCAAQRTRKGSFQTNGRREGFARLLKRKHLKLY